MAQLLSTLPTKKARTWIQKTVSFMAAFYLTDEQKESMPSGVFSSPIVASDIYVPAPGDTLSYKGYFFIAVHRHSGLFKKYSRGKRTPPVIFFALSPASIDDEAFRGFVLETIKGLGEDS